MRLPKENEDLRGKVCICSVGRLFIVTGRTTIKLMDKREAFQSRPEELEGWCGLGLDGKGTAFGTSPCIVAENGQEFHDKLLKRFGGKLSYNG